MGYLHRGLTEGIIRSYYEVYNTLGFGFLEKVYERAMVLELVTAGFDVVNQGRIEVFYKGDRVGDFHADIIVNSVVILELKATEYLVEEHEYQLINYLRATPIDCF
jgi:GxxExxY protein